MSRFLKVLFYVILIIVISLIGIILFKQKPEIQIVFYFAAAGILLYALIVDELFPNKSLTSKKRIIHENRKQQSDL
ncbi:MAG: hypothetical protein ABIN95_13075 [Mucilaginibacter sp.]